ncbi:MAG: hypothetical protein M3Z05_05685 [Gemmatimonadota bacterium]|nr:hypothetical protein [Gemmatimonadota bacterium]
MLLLLSLLSALGAAPTNDSIPGNWQITGDVGGTPVKTVCTIIRTGATLSGNCTNPDGAPYVLTGEVKEKTIVFQYDVDYQGQALNVVYTGTLPSSTELTGSIEVKPMGVSGTFSAVPAKP